MNNSDYIFFTVLWLAIGLAIQYTDLHFQGTKH